MKKEEYTLVPTNDETNVKNGLDETITNQEILKNSEINKSKANSDGKDVSFIGLFRFTDCIDKILILIGLLATILTAVSSPFMFLLYGRIAVTFVDYKKFQYLNFTFNQTITNASEKITCGSKLTEPNTNFDERIYTTIGYLIVAGLFVLFLNYLLQACFNTAAERQIQKMRNALYKSIIRQDMSFFDKNTPGDLNSVLVANIETLKRGISFKLADSLMLLIRSMVCYGLAIVLAWKFSLAYLIITPFNIFAGATMVAMIKKYTAEEFKAYGGAGNIAQESLSSIRTVLALGIHKKLIKSYTENLKSAESMAIKKGLLTGLFGGAQQLLHNCGLGLGIYYAVYLSQQDCEMYSAKTIMPSFFLIITATFALAEALTFIGDLAAARGVAKKIFAIIDLNSQIDIFEHKNGKILENLKGSVEFENVFFNYPQRPEAKILKGLNLNIPAGINVAIVGSSGGGKSTIVSLLQRFYNPLSGTIKIDGHLIQDLDLNWWRTQMALVAQEPILFTTSIKENIRLGKLDASDSEIIDAAKKANAHNFIMSCSDKYDTQVGERGTQLSGGQKQRIAIARALLRNPKILLLDEATSALDNESEKIVQDALDMAKIGRTTIIIAHRLSTIRNADLIVALSDGKFKEMGTHDELMNKKGLYFDLVNTQMVVKKFEKQNSKLSKNEDFESNSSSDEEKEFEKTDSFQRQTSNLSKKNTNKMLPEKSKKQKQSAFKYERKLLSLQKSEISWLIIGSFAQLICGASLPVVSFIFTNIFKIFTIPDEKEQLDLAKKYMFLILIIAIFNCIAQIVNNYSFALAGARLTKKLRIEMFKSMIRQEIAFHDLEENRSSILSTKLSTSVTSCKGLTSDKISLYSQAIAGIGFALVVSLFLNWKLAIVVVVFMPITFSAGNISARGVTNVKMKEGGRFATEEGGKLTTETIENIKTVVSLGREKYFIDEFFKIFNRKFKRTLILLHFSAFFHGVSNSMIFFIQAASFSLGWYLIKYENLEIQDLYRIYTSLTFASMILGRNFSQLSDMKKAKDGAKTAFKIIERKSKIDSLSNEGQKPNQVLGDIKFDNVYFHYPNRPQIKVLNGFNMSCKQGETNALVGSSGCGKSTIIALLLRFYDADSGSIYLDGVDIKKLNIDWLRYKIGLISQEPSLFNLSIYDNICFGDVSRENIPIGEIVDVCNQSNINTRIANLPQKYDTIVGTKGSQLSGGEKQRVAIARALIRMPKILLLDEATSALDSQSEQVVQDALDNAQKGRTCIIIAHRLSTIQNSNKISVVSEGVIVEEGTHTQLMNKKNIYYKLQTSHD